MISKNISEVQQKLSKFNSTLAELEKTASRLEGRHSELVSQLKKKEEEFAEKYPNVDINTLSEERLLGSFKTNEEKLGALSELIEGVKNDLND